MHKHIKFLMVLSLSLIATDLARAEAECDIVHNDCNEVGRWQISVGLGLGVRTNPLVDSDDIPLIVIPQVSYTGEYFFLQNLDAGLFLFENEQHQMNAFITPGYDPIYFHDNHPGNYFIDTHELAVEGGVVEGSSVQGTKNFGDGNSDISARQKKLASWRNLHKRRTAGLAGLEYNISLANVELQGQVVHDVTSVHDGDEVRFSLAKHWLRDRHRFNITLSANWQSKEVINYYYGISAQEADAVSTYIAGSGTSTMVRFDWNYKLSEQWDLRFLASYRQLPTAISHSPIVNDSKVITTFVGGVYHF